MVNSSEFNRIVEKYTDTVFRSALSFCKSKSDAEDVTQNAFIKLLKSEASFESDDHIRKWLIRVVANESKSLWRSSWQRKVISETGYLLHVRTVCSAIALRRVTRYFARSRVLLMLITTARSGYTILSREYRRSSWRFLIRKMM